MKQEQMRIMKKKMIDFLRDEAMSRGFEHVVFGLSGGLDSAVVACLLQEAFGAKAKAVLMPSSRSSKEHFQDAVKLAQSLNLSYEILRLDGYEEIFGAYSGMDRVRYGNLCARARMMILYDVSHRDRALVVGTSNKSERILGYGTIFGDLACAINPIGDVFKSDLFELAGFLGVPEKIIAKKPSADLYPDQSDEEDLALSYEEIDGFLKQIQKHGWDLDDGIWEMMKSEYNEAFHRILHRVRANAFKMQQPKILILH